MTDALRDRVGEWVAGAINIATTEGMKSVPGWKCGPFGADIGYAHNETVWVIHHLATGYAITAIDGDGPMVQTAIEALLTMGDWEFSTPDGANEYVGAIKVMREAGVDTFPATGVKRISAPARATGAA